MGCAASRNDGDSAHGDATSNAASRERRYRSRPTSSHQHQPLRRPRVSDGVMLRPGEHDDAAEVADLPTFDEDQANPSRGYTPRGTVEPLVDLTPGACEHGDSDVDAYSFDGVSVKKPSKSAVPVTEPPLAVTAELHRTLVTRAAMVYGIDGNPDQFAAPAIRKSRMTRSIRACAAWLEASNSGATGGGYGAFCSVTSDDRIAHPGPCPRAVTLSEWGASATTFGAEGSHTTFPAVPGSHIPCTAVPSSDLAWPPSRDYAMPSGTTERTGTTDGPQLVGDTSLAHFPRQPTQSPPRTPLQPQEPEAALPFAVPQYESER